MRGAGTVCALLALLVPAASAAAQEVKPPLTATVRFEDPRGAELTQIAPDQPFRLIVDFAAAVGSVPTDLAPMAWLRQPDENGLSCGETAAAYRATGSAALGSVDLNGPMLAVLSRDNALTVLDPRRSVGTANLVGARRLDSTPADMVADPGSGRWLLSLPSTGELLAVTPFGETETLARGLDRPGALVSAVSGGAWLLEEGSGDVLRPDRGLRLALGAQALAGDADRSPSRRLAVLSPGRVRVIRDDGTELLEMPAPDARAIGLNSEAVLALAPDKLLVGWLDAPEAPPQVIALDGHFDRLAVSPQGRMVYLFAHDRTGFAVVDLALGRVVQGAETSQPVAEIAFLPDTVLLRLADGSQVGVMDLRLIRPGTEAVVGHVTLGPASTQGGAGDRLLVPLLPEPAIMAIHADSYTGFILDGRHAVSGKPPMEALRLRGGIPRLVVALDRGLRAQGAGRFAATARLPQAGPWELVISTAIGQAAFCAMLPTPPGAPQPTVLIGQIQSLAASDGRIRLRFRNADGTPAAGIRGKVDLAMLMGNWRMRVPLSTDPQGLSVESWDLHARLPVVVTAELGASDFAPLLIEAAP